MDLSSGMMRADKGDVFRYVHEHRRRLGKVYERLVRSWFPFQWGEDHERYYKERAVCVGWPQLDVLQRIEPEEIRLRWGVPPGKRVVALLPCPFGNAHGALWERLFMSRGWFDRLLAVVRAGSPGLLRCVIRHTNDRDVIRGLRRLCDHCDTVLATKLRHSRTATNYVKRCTDVIVGEDGYYPHTALELFSIAAFTVGFYTSAVTEALAAGSFFVNVNIPLYPEELFRKLIPVFHDFRAHPGLMSAVDATDLARGKPKGHLEELQINPGERQKFLDKEIGSVDGKSSARFLDAVERLVRGNAGSCCS